MRFYTVPLQALEAAGVRYVHVEGVVVALLGPGETQEVSDKEVMRRKHLMAFARLSANDKLKAMEELLEAFKDRIPRHEFLDSW